MNSKKASMEYIKKSFELKNSKLYKEAVEMLYKALECEDGALNPEIISQIGDLYILLNNPDRALEEYDKALDIDKNHLHSLSQMCKIYYETGRYPQALEVSQRLLEASDDPKFVVDNLSILYKLENFERMKDIFESLNDSLKSNPHVLYIMSKTDFYPKNELLEKAVSADENFSMANFDLGIYYYDLEDFAKSKSFFEKVVSVEKNPDAYYYLGLIKHIEGDFFGAIDCFLECIKYDKTNDACCFELAKAYIDVNWLDEAQIALKSSIKLLKLKNEEHHKLDQHHFLLAWILSKQDDNKSALLYLDLIKEDSAMYPNAQILKNTLLLNGSGYAAAKKVLEEYYQNDAEEAQNPILLDSLGKIYKHLKMYNEAIDLYKKALSFYPNSVFYTLELIDILIDNKCYDEALERAQELEKNSVKCPNTYNSMARVYYRLKNYDAAIENLMRLNEIDINNAEGFYFLGLVQNDTNQSQAALENFKIALTLNPTPAKYYAQAARAHEALGNYDEALLYIKEAIEIAPEEINYSRQARDIAQKMGNKEKADFYSSQIMRLEQLLRQRES